MKLKVEYRTSEDGHLYEVHISPGFLLRWSQQDRRSGEILIDEEDADYNRGERRFSFGLDGFEADKVIEAFRLWKERLTAEGSDED